MKANKFPNFSPIPLSLSSPLISTVLLSLSPSFYGFTLEELSHLVTKSFDPKFKVPKFADFYRLEKAMFLKCNLLITMMMV